jgi:hypothetical protein
MLADAAAAKLRSAGAVSPIPDDAAGSLGDLIEFFSAINALCC